MPQDRIDANRLATWLLVAIALLVPVLALIGWTFDLPRLRGLGNPNYSGAPLTALLFLLIAIAMTAVMVRRPLVSQLILALPATMIALLAIQHALGVDLGLQRLIFAEGIRRLGVANDGLPGVGVATVLALDIISVWLVARPRVSHSFWAGTIASAAFALSCIGATITVLNSPAEINPGFIGSSTVSALPVVALNLAVVLRSWYRSAEFTVQPGWRIVWRLAPAIIILPVVPSLAALLANHFGMIRVNEGLFLVALGNILLVAAVLLYAIRHASGQNRELSIRAAQLRATLATVPDAMIVADGQGTILDFSAAAEKLWACHAGEVVGQSIEGLLTPGSRERYAAELDALRQSKDALAVDGLTNAMGRRRDGAEFPIEFRIGVARAAGEKRFTMFVRDLTEQLAAEDHVAELNYQLIHLSRMNAMGELAADMAHELNQPLAAAANFLGAAILFEEAGTRPEEDAALLQRAKEQVLRAGDIIRRLRAFTVRQEVETRAENLASLIEDAAQLVLVGSGRLGVQIYYDLDPAALRVLADRIQVQQVIVNLLRNAIEAVRTVPGRQARIHISSRRLEGPMVEVTFVDNGPGLPEEMLDQLYTRSVSTKLDTGAGMGIGLSISKRIIEAHSGTLNARNLPQGGACFTFTLPLFPVDEFAR